MFMNKMEVGSELYPVLEILRYLLTTESLTFNSLWKDCEKWRELW